MKYTGVLHDLIAPAYLFTLFRSFSCYNNRELLGLIKNMPLQSR